MNNEIRAEQLANQPYITQILREALPSGEIIIVAQNPELLGCTAMGETIEQARRELYDVRVKYILHLLEHGLPVPGPAHTLRTELHGYVATFIAHLEPQGSSREIHIDQAPVIELQAEEMGIKSDIYIYSPGDGTLQVA